MCGQIAGIILGVAGTALKVGGALVKGRLDSDAALINAEIARNNTAILESNVRVANRFADVTSQRGAFEENRLRAQVGKVLASQKVGFAHGGIDPGFGSPLVLAGLTAAQGEVDVNLIRADAAGEKARLLASAASEQGAVVASAWQESGFLQSARQSRIAGWFGAGTALLAGAQELWSSVSAMRGGGGGRLAAGAA